MLLREAEALRHADYQTATGVPAFHQTLPSHLRPRRAKQHCSHQRPHSSMRYDARSLTLRPDCQTVSPAVCHKERITGQLQMSARMRNQLRLGELGSAELVYRKRNFYLHISITIPAPEVNQPQGSLGVDLGFNRVAVTSDNKFHTAKNIRHKKSCYKRTRRSLQANGSKSAKRALQRVSGRERRFVADTNHCVSKQIVADSKVKNQRIVLEDLNGIRETGKAKCVHEWSFAQLQWMIRYKAARAGVEVVTVSPRYISQTCSRCLHLGVRPSQSNFQCRDCGYQINGEASAGRLAEASQTTRVTTPLMKPSIAQMNNSGVTSKNSHSAYS